MLHWLVILKLSGAEVPELRSVTTAQVSAKRFLKIYSGLRINRTASDRIELAIQVMAFFCFLEDTCTCASERASLALITYSGSPKKGVLESLKTSGLA